MRIALTVNIAKVVVMASVKRDFDIDSTSVIDEDYRHYFSVLGFMLAYFLELPNVNLD